MVLSTNKMAAPLWLESADTVGCMTKRADYHDVRHYSDLILGNPEDKGVRHKPSKTVLWRKGFDFVQELSRLRFLTIETNQKSTTSNSLCRKMLFLNHSFFSLPWKLDICNLPAMFCFWYGVLGNHISLMAIILIVRGFKAPVWWKVKTLVELALN